MRRVYIATVIVIVLGSLLLALPTCASALLKIGARGEEVRDVQSMLYQLGLLQDNPDGIYGSITKGAVEEYQRLLGLVADGIVGEETKEALEKSAGRANPFPLLKSGERSPEVIYLQAHLLERGLVSNLTGSMDTSTIEAVKEFQRENSLLVDGIVGPATWNAIAREEERAEIVEIVEVVEVAERIQEREEGQEAIEVTREILRSGDKGPMVAALQQRLKSLHFYHGPINGHYGLQTTLAVKLTQQFYGLVVDGIMGPATWSAIEGAEKNLPQRYIVQRGDTIWGLTRRWQTTIDELQRINSITNINQIREGDSLFIPGTYQVEKKAVRDIHWNEVNTLFPVNTTAIITDVESGLSFRVKRLFGSYHADIEPLTANDTEILRAIYNGQWSWERRAVIAHLGSVSVAGSINGFPHDSQSIYTNNFNGHICLHFRGSRLHNSGHPDYDHQQEIQLAARQMWPLAIP